MIETIAEGLTLAEKNNLGVENLQKMLGVVFPGPYMVYSKHMISGGYYQDEVRLTYLPTPSSSGSHATLCETPLLTHQNSPK